MKTVIVTGSFDDLRSYHVRFLEEVARLGRVHLLLWSDAVTQALEGKTPRFPEAERQYFLGSIRSVDQITLITDLPDIDTIPGIDALHADVWAVTDVHDTERKRAFCAARGLDYHVIPPADLSGFPAVPPPQSSDRKKVIVTGCFDWLHSGHVRFFEEASELGDLYVAVGNDANVTLLKGTGHPLFNQDERRYMVQSIRFVTQALITSGSGWMDAAPDIDRLKPDLYVVNEDGDKPEKRAFCAEHGLEYVVLTRAPKPGLPKRESTALRGF